MDQVRDPAAMRAWLATIGRRICRRMKQKDALRPILALDEEPSTTPCPEEVMEQARVHECVDAAMRSLPKSYREAYELRDVQGFSAEEAAKRAGIGVRNLKSRLHRARKLIRQSLDSGICGDITQ